MIVSYKMFYVSSLLLYNTLQAATPLVDTTVYEALCFDPWCLYGTGCFLKLLKSVFSTLSYAYTKKTPTFLAHPVGLDV